MDWQEIVIGVLMVLAIVYLVRYFYVQTKSHNCGDCDLMDMKKKGQLNKVK